MDLDAVARTAEDHGAAITWRRLLAHHPDHLVRAAVRAGVLLRAARGRYVLPACPDPVRQALVHRGVVSHESAARLWFLETLHQPTTTHLTLPATSRGRGRVRGTQLHWRDLEPSETDGYVTAPLRTVLDCARTLPFADALAIADSALRRRLVSKDELERAAGRERSRGIVGARKVLAAADARAANPFESGLRAVLIERGVTGFVPQLPFRTPRLRGLVDLGDPVRRIALEADSFEFHGSRGALDRDCRRYDELVRTGWLVLRFSWEQVMSDRIWLGDTVVETVALREPSRTRRSRSVPGRSEVRRGR